MTTAQNNAKSEKALLVLEIDCRGHLSKAVTVPIQLQSMNFLTSLPFAQEYYSSHVLWLKDRKGTRNRSLNLTLTLNSKGLTLIFLVKSFNLYL